MKSLLEYIIGQQDIIILYSKGKEIYIYNGVNRHTVFIYIKYEDDYKDERND